MYENKDDSKVHREKQICNHPHYLSYFHAHHTSNVLQLMHFSLKSTMILIFQDIRPQSRAYQIVKKLRVQKHPWVSWFSQWDAHCGKSGLLQGLMHDSPWCTAAPFYMPSERKKEKWQRRFNQPLNYGPQLLLNMKFKHHQRNR